MLWGVYLTPCAFYRAVFPPWRAFGFVCWIIIIVQLFLK